MVDNVSKEERSRIMSSVKHKDTRPEIAVRSFLHRIGFRYLLHDKRLPGIPDMVFPKHGCVLFVHGCFWHGHQDPACKLARIPKSNVQFWISKVKSNVERNKRDSGKLTKMGWRVIVVWECQVRESGYLLALKDKIRTDQGV